MKITGIVILLALLGAARLQAGPDKADLSLALIWSTAEETLPLYPGTAAAIQAIEHSRKALPVWYRPGLTLDFGYDAAANTENYQHGFLARPTAFWNIWDGGIGSISRDIYALGIRSLELEHEVEKRRFRVFFAELFFSLSKNARDLAMRNDELASFEKLRTLVVPRLRIGAASASDLQDVDIHLRRIRAGMVSLNNAQQRLLDTLEIYLGKEFIEKYSTIPALDTLFDNEIKTPLPQTAALDENPLLRHLAMEIQMLEQEQRLKRAELYAPSLQLRIHGGMETPAAALDPGKPEIAAGLAFSIPLLSSTSRVNTLKALRMNNTAREHQLAQKRLEIHHYFRQQHSHVQTIREEALAVKLLVAAQKANTDLAFTEFSRGLKTTSDMISVIRTLNEDLAEYADYQYRLLLLACSYSIETAPAHTFTGSR